MSNLSPHSCGSCLKHGPNSSRLYSKNRSSQRYVKQDPWEPVHERSKSLRWTKEQLEKFENLIEPTKQQNETGSSSSGDNLTDDSGIHSKSTSKDSPRLVTKSIINYDQPQKSIIKYDQPVQPVKIERVAIGRRPVRKLPAVPSSKQAHIVQLKSEHKKLRALPQLPTEENNKESSSKLAKQGLRLSNFFRSVKFPRNKKIIQTAPIRIFGRELNDLVKATNQEVPEILTKCTKFVEDHGMVDGIYRISGIASNIKRLKTMFDTQTVPEPLYKEDWIQQDLHSVPSLIKLFFRELPDPMCSEKMLPLLKKGATIATLNSDTREAMPCFREVLESIGTNHFNTLKHLMIHLQKVAQRSKDTGMSSKNLAIVWAPNLIKTSLSTHEEQQQIVENSAEHTKLQYNLVQNTQIVQYMIDNAKWLFDENNSKKDHAHVTTVKINNNNQLPPQFLERVKFINVEEQQPVSLSKRYSSSDQMNHSGPKKSSLIFEGLNDETNHGGNGLIHRLWNYPFSGANSSSKRPISMDFSDMYNHHTHHPDPCYVQGVHNHRHVHQPQHHPYHQQLPQPQQHHHHCLQNNLHVSDV